MKSKSVKHEMDSFLFHLIADVLVVNKGKKHDAGSSMEPPRLLMIPWSRVMGTRSSLDMHMLGETVPVVMATKRTRARRRLLSVS